VQSGHVLATEFIGNLTATEASIQTLSASNANLIIDEVSLGVANVLVYADEDGLLAPSSIEYDGTDIGLTGNVISDIRVENSKIEIHGETNTNIGLQIRTDNTYSSAFTNNYGIEVQSVFTNGANHGMLLNYLENNSDRRILDIRSNFGKVASFVSNGRFGLGTESPAYTLDCRGTIYSNDKVYVNNGATGPPALGMLGGSGTRLVFWPGTDVSVYPFALGVDSSTLWYGTNTATSSYHRWYGGSTQMMYLTNSNLSVIGNITAYASDARLKENTKPLTNILDRVKKLQGYTFTWKEGVDGLTMSGPDLGLLAQDVEDAGFLEAITLAPFDTDNGLSKSGFNYKTIHYNKLHAVWASSVNALHQKIQEQDQKILEQNQKIQEQDEKIVDLEQRLTKLEALLDQAP
jgi:hypothetical protein